jgi:hypothetical protein
MWYTEDNKKIAAEGNVVHVEYIYTYTEMRFGDPSSERFRHSLTQPAWTTL